MRCGLHVLEQYSAHQQSLSSGLRIITSSFIHLTVARVTHRALA
jgi:hypothetical protein